MGKIMIAANDLRIGNLFEYNTSEGWELNTIDHEDIRQCVESNEYFNEYYRPIPLTEDMLLKCGFEQRKSLSSIEYFIGTNEVTYDWLFSITWLNHPESINAPNAPFYRNGRHTIYFLHQLQNLYYALTQKELTITL